MSTTDNTDSNVSNAVEDQNLDDFAAEFFGRSSAKNGDVENVSESTNSEDDNHQDIELDTEEALVEDAEEGSEPDGTPSEDSVDESEDEEEIDDDSGKPKTRYQKRIDQIVKEREEEKRERLAQQARADELERRLSELERARTNPEPQKQEDTPKNLAPDPEALNEDGSPKYPLKRYDPEYIADRTRFEVRQEIEAEKAKELEKARLTEQEKEAAKLQENWDAKLPEAQEKHTDFIPKVQTLVNRFQTLEPSYAKYLTDTIMSMDKGTDVLYYLADNPEEATKIVNSGATKATIALGRIEAGFADEVESQPPTTPIKVSKAPTPPERTNKGSSPAKPRVRPDTDNLDDFEKVFFKK